MSDTEQPVNESVFDVSKGTAFIAGEVNETMQRQFMQFFLALNAKGYSGPIDIMFSSAGGDVSAALAIYDMLKTVNDLGVKIYGECKSSGVIILQGAARRTASRHSQFLIHFGIETVESKPEQNHNRKIEQQMRDLIAARTGKPKGTVSRWMAGESYFTAEEAKEASLIDEVV
jgi:ATP-dependent Clp protease protease subunit